MYLCICETKTVWETRRKIWRSESLEYCTSVLSSLEYVFTVDYTTCTCTCCRTPNWKTEELSQENDWFGSLKGYLGHPITLLAACAVMVLINNAWIVPVLVEHKESVALHAEFLELKDRFEAENIQYQATISELKDRDVQLTARVSQLEATNEQHQGTISELQLQVVQLERGTSELEASKANQDEVDQLSNNMAELNGSKVDNDEFNDLVDTVSELATTKVDRSTVMELEEELAGLAETALNHTHYDQLQDGIDGLESAKASQTQFEELVSNFTSLANTTVRTSEFLLLSERVEHIDDTTVKEAKFLDVTRNVTTLEGDIKHINVTLAKKADQQGIKEITDTITTLKKTTVRKDEFKKLVTRVGSKADKSDLDNLKRTVTHLGQTDTEHELNSLSEKVASHITSSQNDYYQLRSDISHNEQEIRSLKGSVESVKSDFEEMKSKKCFLWICKG